MMSEGVYKAIIFTLLVHACVLLYLNRFIVSDVRGMVINSVDIEFVDVPDFSREDKEKQEAPEEQELGRDNVAANLRADESLELSNEKTSTSLSASEKSRIEAQVAKELAEFESSEFQRLADDEKEFDSLDLPDLGDSDAGQDTRKDWDKQHDGKVTVRFYLQGRSSSYLDVPSYKCENRADVLVEIEVNRDGRVVKAEVVSGASAGSCFYREAILSAEKSRFKSSPSADKKQKGTIMYAFVAQ